MTDVSTNCAVVIFRVKVSCITSTDGITLWLMTRLVNYFAMLLVVCQLSRDVIEQLMNEAEYLMKNYGDGGGCYGLDR